MLKFKNYRRCNILMYAFIGCCSFAVSGLLRVLNRKTASDKSGLYPLFFLIFMIMSLY
ncbi:hypothetical protein KsCSTR_14940 [Candidatus Kuenenia stuttgartiensis]|uniref:Uncharacterized protein n=1 Tax=Kuenenia stuttgartiensis TaxID=174633 RepID=Q1Q1G3_KUEST|nr:hypothetical protein KsCSTR_14940 [Candidatus Kuenenia stuttgartiensis]CAJ73847.1 unknown protein [Candidatus Kuenenia stuttgartiensis]